MVERRITLFFASSKMLICTAAACSYSAEFGHAAEVSRTRAGRTIWRELPVTNDITTGLVAARRLLVSEECLDYWGRRARRSKVERDDSLSVASVSLELPSFLTISGSYLYALCFTVKSLVFCYEWGM